MSASESNILEAAQPPVVGGEWTEGFVTALSAIRESFLNLAREDIDGESGTVTYAEVLAGIDAGLATIDTLARA